MIHFLSRVVNSKRSAAGSFDSHPFHQWLSTMMSSTYCDAPCIEQHASIKQMCFIQQKGNNAGSIRSGTDQAPALNGFQPFPGLLERTEERRVGKECVSTCRSRGTQYN